MEREYIYKIVEDMDGVDCYIKTGQIVRCKNCRYYETDDDTWCVFHDAHWVKHENDFCSYGEWRDDDRVY